MRIAFISEAFMGSILPLVRNLCQRGHTVDLYYYRREINEPEACELSFKSPHFGINAVPQHLYKGITRYVGSCDFRILTFSQMQPFASVPVVRNVAALVLRHQARKAARYINSQHYDIVNFVCNYSMDYMSDLLHYLCGNVVMSMHEVWDHANPSSKPSELLAETIRKKCKIVLFSKNSYHDISQINGVDMNLVHVNPFGLFESFASLDEKELPEQLPEKFILFFGFILPYKGLCVLHNAIKQMGDALRDYKVVIAGKGNDPVLDEIKNDSRYVIIPRFIKNGELVTLIRRSYIVVCPYLSMSQSGIPQTAFPFHVPVIASDLDGFKEIVTPDVGMLFPANDPNALAEKLSAIVAHPEVRENMSRNAKNFSQNHPEYDWHNICDRFLEFVTE